jgi:hypothetical protein
MLVVVLELLRRDGLAKVEAERVQHVLLAMSKGRMLGNLGSLELGVANRSRHQTVCVCESSLQVYGRVLARQRDLQLSLEQLAHIKSAVCMVYTAPQKCPQPHHRCATQR